MEHHHWGVPSCLYGEDGCTTNPTKEELGDVLHNEDDFEGDVHLDFISSSLDRLSKQISYRRWSYRTSVAITICRLMMRR